MQPIEKGSDPKMFLMAAGAGAAAVAVVLIAVLTELTLKVGRLELPQWSWFVVAAGLLAVAGFTAFLGVGVERCAACKAPLVNHEAYFELSQVPAVLAAVTHVDPAQVEQLAPVPKAQMKSVVSISYCEKCRAVGTLQAKKWEDYQPHDLSEERTIQGPVVARFAALAEKHLAFRGDDED